MIDVRNIDHDEIKNIMSQVLNTCVTVEVFNGDGCSSDFRVSKFKFSKHNVNVSIVVRHQASPICADVAAYAQSPGETLWDSLDVVMRLEDMADAIKLIRYVHDVDDVDDEAHEYAANLADFGGDPDKIPDHASNADALRTLISKLRSDINSVEFKAYSESYRTGYLECLDDMEALLPEHAPEDRPLYVFGDPSNVKLPKMKMEVTPIVDGVIQKDKTRTYDIEGDKA